MKKRIINRKETKAKKYMGNYLEIRKEMTKEKPKEKKSKFMGKKIYEKIKIHNKALLKASSKRDKNILII